MNTYMINNYFNSADIKAICQTRQFDKKCLKSAELLASSLASTCGLAESIASLTDQERIFLRYLNDREVKVDFFKILYPEDCDHYGTFNQMYSGLFKIVWKNLVRKGLLSVSQSFAYIGDSKMDQWRFKLPSLYRSYLSAPFCNVYQFEQSPLPQDQTLRDHITNVVSGLNKKQSNYRISIRDDVFCVGKESFSLSKLDAWRRNIMNTTCYPKFHYSINLNRANDQLVDALQTAINSLKPNEFFMQKDIRPLIKFIIDPKHELSVNTVCETAVNLGYFSLMVHNNKTYYGRANTLKTQLDIQDYLSYSKDGFEVNLYTIPYTQLEQLTDVCNFKLVTRQKQRRLLVQPDIIRLAKQDIQLLQSPLIQWMKDQSTELSLDLKNILDKHGKILLHHGLQLAKISDLRLQAAFSKRFKGHEHVISLPDQHYAFPPHMSETIQKFVVKAGYAVKSIKPESIK